MSKRADMVIGETIGWDYKEVQEYRYQRYANPAVYAIGERYFAVHSSKPRHRDVGGEWREYEDQFGARNTNRKIWVCDAVSAEAK